MLAEKLPPVHPGAVLIEDYMKPLGITPQFWLNLQSQYDLALAEEALAGRLEKEVRVRERAA
jgi:plasmid maintenance system antidote protein VapI